MDSSLSPALPTGTPDDAFKRGNVLAAACPSREILNHLTNRWGVLVLIALQPGTQRFSQLKRSIGGVSERMLAQTLQLLESDGMLERHAYKVVPPHVEYTLTPLGHQAAAKVRDLVDWIELNLPSITTHAATRRETPEPRTP